MVAYAESSAVLAWLLGEPDGAIAASAFKRADHVVASVLTGVECSRAIVRAAHLGELSKTDARRLSLALAEAEEGWHRLEVSERVLSVARAPFPAEPLRTLDAIHVASAVIAHEAYRDLVVVTFDNRVRASLVGLGIPLIDAPRA